MPADTFDLTWQDVLPELPFDSTSIGATSNPSSDDLTAYLEDGGSQMRGAMNKAGVGASADLDADTLRQVQDAIKAYAAAKAMGKIGYMGAERDARLARFNDLLNTFANRPQMLATGTVALRTNVDTSDTKPARVFNLNYRW